MGPVLHFRTIRLRSRGFKQTLQVGGCERSWVRMTRRVGPLLLEACKPLCAPNDDAANPEPSRAPLRPPRLDL
jgi:hypothetical protein